ncbi:MAG: CHAD domain-containing protein, partial [Gemmatimonadetes bacterium]|nr:CHAD domain-containing protein [Gemmatimonadota bacterium]
RVARREAAREELLHEIRTPRYTALLDRLVGAASEPAVLPEVAGEPAAKVLGTLMERPWKHLKNTAGSLGRDAADEELHLVRIRVKRARYAAEALSPDAPRLFAEGVPCVVEGP